MSNLTASSTLSFSGVYDSLKIVDTTSSIPAGPGFWDCYDIDSVGVTFVTGGGGVTTPVPLPFAGATLGASLVGLGLLRSRRRG